MAPLSKTLERFNRKERIARGNESGNPRTSNMIVTVARHAFLPRIMERMARRVMMLIRRAYRAVNPFS